MSKSRKPSKRQLNRFPGTKAHGDRLNPKSIRKLIYDVIRDGFDGNVNAAAEMFENARRLHKGRSYKTSVTAESYYRIVHDQQIARYMHLEAIAIYLKVPVGLILLYSRLTAEQNELSNPRLRLSGILEALDRILQQASSKVENAEQIENLFQYSDLKLWTEFFKERRRPKASQAPSEN